MEWKERRFAEHCHNEKEPDEGCCREWQNMPEHDNWYLKPTGAGNELRELDGPAEADGQSDRQKQADVAKQVNGQHPPS